MLFGKKARMVRQLQSGDIVAAREAIDHCREEGWLSDGTLRGADLDGAVLSGMNLDGATLPGTSLLEADLSRASLRDVDLEDADLTAASLAGADLRGAQLVDAVLQSVDFSEAQIELVQLVLADSMAGATLPDGTPYDGRFNLPGDLSVAKSEGAFRDRPEELAEWYGVSPEAYEAGQDWADDHLHDLRVKARYAIMGPRSSWAREMREAGQLTDGSLRGQDLSAEDLAWSDLHGAMLPEVCLEEANLADANLREADLQGADLYAADMQGADLTGANLSGADLSEADCRCANFTNANLQGAVVDATLLDRANLQGAAVTEAQLVLADRLAGATMPDGTRYDGRYDLTGDIDGLLDDGIEMDSADEMAHWYNVSLEEYAAGQAWASMNLAKLRPDEAE